MPSSQGVAAADADAPDLLRSCLRPTAFNYLFNSVWFRMFLPSKFPSSSFALLAACGALVDIVPPFVATLPGAVLLFSQDTAGIPLKTLAFVFVHYHMVTLCNAKLYAELVAGISPPNRFLIGMSLYCGVMYGPVLSGFVVGPLVYLVLTRLLLLLPHSHWFSHLPPSPRPVPAELEFDDGKDEHDGVGVGVGGGGGGGRDDDSDSDSDGDDGDDKLQRRSPAVVGSKARRRVAVQNPQGGQQPRDAAGPATRSGRK